MQMRKQLIIVAFLLLTACGAGGSKHFEPSGVPAGPEATLSSQPLTAPPGNRTDIVGYVAEIDNAAVPAGVDPLLWQALRDSLKQALASRQASAPPAADLYTLDQRSVSFTPYGTQNMVRDLQLSGSGPWLLSWTYRNSGDYDLNGSVNISDLTPIGIHYGAKEAAPLWFLALNADGDGNGEINIADITPIGQNYGGTIVGYGVFGTNDLAGEWNHLGNATVDANLHKNADRLRFVIQLDSLEYSNYALWPYDNSEDEGDWSNTAALGSGSDRRIAGIRNYWSRLK